MATKEGYSRAMGAATIVNAIANWKGSAFSVNLWTTADVRLEPGRKVVGDVPGVDTRLIERCVELVLKRFDLDLGGVIKTTSQIPLASGLKSSSAAANAAVLATLDAIGEEMDLLDATRIGVQAARETGVTITGAFDDASASMLGGVVVTDNKNSILLKREEMTSDVLLLVPDERLFSKDTDVLRSRVMAPMADLAIELALKGDYCRAMTLNGLAYCAALRRPVEPIFQALKAGAKGATLSGTGPSYAALVDESSISEVEAIWSEMGKSVIRTKIENNCASRGRGNLNGSVRTPPGSSKDR